MTAPINPTSYGLCSSHILKEMTKLGHRISLFPIGQVQPAYDEFVPALQQGLENAKMFDPKAISLRKYHQFDMAQHVGTPKVGFTVFELNRLKDQELHHLSTLDLVISPTEWQKDIVSKSIKDSKNAVVELGVDTSVFKPYNMEKANRPFTLLCVVPDTMVNVFGMPTKIRDVNIGDMVLTHNGNFRKITDKFQRKHKGKIYKITCEGGLSFAVTPEHPVFSVTRGTILCKYKKGKNDVLCRDKRNNVQCPYCHDEKQWKPKWVEACKLKVGDFLVYPVNMEEQDFVVQRDDLSIPVTRKLKYSYEFPIKINEDMAALIGWFLSEGSFIKCDGIPHGIQITNKNESHLAEIYDKAKRVFGNARIYQYYKGSKCGVVQIPGKEVAYLFKYLCGEYSYGKQLHPSLLKTPLHIQMSLFDAFIKGDGHVSKARTVTTMCSISKTMIDQLFYIARRLGYRPSVRTVGVQHHCYKGRNVDGKFPIYTITFCYGGKSHFHTDKNLMYAKVRNIEVSDYDGDVCNIEVSDDNSYTANGLAVHNCVGKWEERKNYENILKCFDRAFSPHHDVELFLICHCLMPEIQKNIERQLGQTLSNMALAHKVKVLPPNFMPLDQLVKIYNLADCYISYARAEGFSEPNVEAMACGKPIIATYCTGQTQYLDNEEGVCKHGWLIKPTGLIPANDGVFFDGFGEWHDFNNDHLIEAMRYAYQNWKGVVNSYNVNRAAQFTWENTAKRLTEVLQTL
jgi:hypothetical protein